MKTKRFFSFETIINVLNVSYFRFINYLCYGSTAITNILFFFSARIVLYTPESDVCSRQILTYKDGPRAEKVKACVLYLLCLPLSPQMKLLRRGKKMFFIPSFT